MTTDKEKKLCASLFMVLLVASPFTVLSDDTFCTKTWAGATFNDYSGFAVDTAGNLYSWGVNQFGQLGYGSPGLIQSTPVLINPSGPPFIQTFTELNYVLTRASNGSIYGWGSNTHGNLGPGVPLGGIQTTPKKINVLGVCNSVAGHAAGYTSYAIKAAGTLWAFGDNSHAQLGKPTATLAQSATPVKIGNDNDWDFIRPARRDYHVCGLKTNASLFCWGENYYGQVGDGTATDRPIPKRIGSAADTWSTVATVLYATIALHSNGTLWGWGTTFYGLFGDGKDYSQYKVPTQIAGGMTFKAIAVHDNYMIAIGTNGKLYGWGDNRYTQVNSNSAVGIQNTPNQLASGTNWDRVWVSIGVQMNAIGSAFATKTNGNLFAWGSNEVGQLGLGLAASTVATPTKVNGIGSNVTSLFSTGYNTGIVNSNDELYVTGFNNFNTLGDGTINTANDFFSCADRTMKCVSHTCQTRRLRF